MREERAHFHGFIILYARRGSSQRKQIDRASVLTEIDVSAVARQSHLILNLAQFYFHRLTMIEFSVIAYLYSRKCR